MKITEVITDTNIGGAGVLLSSVVTSLKNDFSFEVILPQDSLLVSRFPSEIKVTKMPIAGDKSFSKRDVMTLASYFRSTRPDVVHTHASLSARLAARLSCGAACCSTRHCSHPSHTVGRLSAAKRALYNLCTDITVSTADHATENLVRSGIPKERIITIKNGSPDLSEHNTKGSLSLADLGIDENAIIIGSVARLESVKGQDVILRAAPKIIAKFPTVSILFLGDGSRRDEYKRLAAALGVEKNVRFLGFVEDPSAYQRLFKINLNASRGTETSCLATSECLSLGIPTVASDFGGNTEMIRSLENGLIFPSDNPHALAEAVIRLLSDRKLYERVCKGARTSYTESFSLKAMAEKYRTLYSLLGMVRRGHSKDIYEGISALR